MTLKKRMREQYHVDGRILTSELSGCTSEVVVVENSLRL